MERVARHVEQRHTFEPRQVDVLRPKASTGTSLTSEGARAALSQENRDGACRLRGNPRRNLDTRTFQLGYQAAAEVVVAHPGDQPRRLSEACRPRAEVRGLPSATDLYTGVAVVIGNEVALRGNGHVQQQLADRADQLNRGLQRMPAC